MFSRKRQARIWMISLIYKYLNRKTRLFSEIIQNQVSDSVSILDISTLRPYMRDDLIFVFDKGDVNYFWIMYNCACEKILIYREFLKGQHALANPTLLSIAITFFTEMHLGIVDEESLTKEYQKIVADYTDSNLENAIIDIWNVYNKTNINQ